MAKKCLVLQLCVLGALELSDTSNAPLARERGEEELQRRGATDEHLRLGLRRGEGREGGKEGREMRRRERVWEGTEEEWMRNKREGWRQWGVKLDSYFIEYITQNQEGGDVCLMFDSTNIFVACFWWTLPDFTCFSSLIDKIMWFCCFLIDMHLMTGWDDSIWWQVQVEELTM